MRLTAAKAWLLQGAHMWHDYGGLVAPAAAIINGFIAVLIAQFFRNYPIVKLVLVIAAGFLGFAAIGATFYTQHQIVSDRAAAVGKQATIREILGLFVAEGDSLMQVCSDSKQPVPLKETKDWITRVESFLSSQLGQSYVRRFEDPTGAPSLTLNGADADHQNIGNQIYYKVLRLEQFSQQSLS
jgi:hypothetical protein